MATPAPPPGSATTPLPRVPSRRPRIAGGGQQTACIFPVGCQRMAEPDGWHSTARLTGRRGNNVSAEPMEKIPMTRAGFAALNDELKQLKSVERPAIIAAIAEARALGDLSENAEYHSAREKQSFIEGRIKELEAILSLSEVIDPASLSGPIKFGATVKLVDEDTEEERTFQIVGEPEANLERGLLNIRSPLARALIGKEPGDSIEVSTPGGEKSYEVLSVDYV